MFDALLARICRSEDAAIAAAGRHLVSRDAFYALPCLQQLTAEAVLHLMEDLASNVPANKQADENVLHQWACASIASQASTSEACVPYGPAVDGRASNRRTSDLEAEAAMPG
ncbi:unnamed protein product [Symbiodinium sp. CCMP2592]|nr:unnamed protein product [Symbiodinium sp. CCMP2592]